MALTINIDEQKTTVVTFSLEGSLDTSTYLLLERRVDRVLESDAAVIVFDMHRVDYMSSAGVRVILKAKKSLKKRNGHVFLLHLQPQIRKVFDFINALPSLEAYPVEVLDMHLDQIQQETPGKSPVPSEESHHGHSGEGKSSGSGASGR